MILLIIIIMVCIYLFYSEFKVKSSLKFKLIRAIIDGSISGVGIYAALWLIIIICWLWLSPTKTQEKVIKYDKKQLIALTNSKKLSGSFYLFSGSIKSELCYYFFELNKDGSKELNYIKAVKTKIFEDKQSAPYIISLGKHYNTTRNIPAWMNYLICPRSLLPQKSKGTVFLNYEIHVPPGTIRSEIDLDLNNL